MVYFKENILPWYKIKAGKGLAKGFEQNWSQPFFMEWSQCAAFYRFGCDRMSVLRTSVMADAIRVLSP
jgi:hypothetical protein